MEADLAFRGIDLHKALRKRRVRYLLNLVDHLPRSSFTQEAMAQDDELVESIWKPRSVLDDDDGPARIRLSEFSPEVEALYGAIDRLGDVVSGIAALGGKRAPRIPAMKRPETAWQRIEERHLHAVHDRTKAQLLPNG